MERYERFTDLRNNRSIIVCNNGSVDLYSESKETEKVIECYKEISALGKGFYLNRPWQRYIVNWGRNSRHIVSTIKRNIISNWHEICFARNKISLGSLM